MNKRRRLIVIVGPTASGKSAHAMKMAEECDGEIISADSRQIYEGFPATTNKPSSEDMARIPHHLVSAIPLEHTYSAFDFQRDADNAISDIWSRRKTPIVCGGTLFYVQALLFDGLLPHVARNEAFRKSKERKATPFLYRDLQHKAPTRARAIHPHDRYRIIRALEIYEALGSIPNSNPTLRYEYELFIRAIDRSVHKQRLLERFEERLPRMVSEVGAAPQETLTPSLVAKLGFEFSLTLSHVEGNLTEAELLTRLVEKEWQYSKRQERLMRILGAHTPPSGIHYGR